MLLREDKTLVLWHEERSPYVAQRASDAVPHLPAPFLPSLETQFCTKKRADPPAYTQYFGAVSS